MDISARSYLTAGMVAVVGAGGIAMTPVLPSAALPTVQLPAHAVAEVALAGTSLPLDQIWTLVQTLGTGGSLNDIVNGVFRAVGTEFVGATMFLVAGAATDVATYLGTALTDVISLGALKVDFPGILSGVGTALGAGDFPGALKAVNDGLSAPITHVVQTVFGPGFQAFLSDKVGTVLGALPEILRSAVQKVLGLDIKPMTDAISAALSGLLPAPGASTPVALAMAEAPTIVCNMPAIRPTESPVPAAVVVEAPSAPRAAAAVAADAPAEPTPTRADAGEAPAVTVEAPPSVVESNPDTEVTTPKVAHRGASATGDAKAAAPKAATGHRGAAQG